MRQLREGGLCIGDFYAKKGKAGKRGRKRERSRNIEAEEVRLTRRAAGKKSEARKLSPPQFYFGIYKCGRISAHGIYTYVCVAAKGAMVIRWH